MACTTRYIGDHLGIYMLYLGVYGVCAEPAYTGRVQRFIERAE